MIGALNHGFTVIEKFILFPIQCYANVWATIFINKNLAFFFDSKELLVVVTEALLAYTWLLVEARGENGCEEARKRDKLRETILAEMTSGTPSKVRSTAK